ncbi:MAG: glucose-1-phosphate cytidylyltransferase [Proteobacteria bacterium]|nr:glucose-1-phosphate cytidylyltransferase [Pseudomonadota bacterium]
MKVVLFCGGLGTRLREQSETIPKPLVNIGYRPLLWHLMRYYAHYGHRDFILCLGYRGDLIREYFLRYNEAMSNDFTWHEGGKRIELHGHETSNWNVTFVDTGLHSNIGQRLLRVRHYLDDESEFLANYSDGLSDAPLDSIIEDFRAKKAVASFLSVRSPQSFHMVKTTQQGIVTSFGAVHDLEVRINGGFFALRHEIFDYLNEGEELVEQPFGRLIEKQKLVAYGWDGFWQCMDTYKDKITYERLEAKGDCPWKVWEAPAPAGKL